MSPLPTLHSHSPFVSKDQDFKFFFPFLFFFLPLEENSIVLFLVVTTWLLATTFILLRALPEGLGGMAGNDPVMPGMQWAPGTPSS